MPLHTLVLVDALAALYRAFYGIRELSTSSGQATNAVYGFVRMLEQIKETWNPTHMAVLFDGGLPEERTQVIEDYKGQRPPTPDALLSQFPIAEDYLERAGIAWARQEGQEADDLIASMAAWAAPHCDRILIASSDKDLYQLVDEKTVMIKASGKNPELMGVEEVRAKTGVLPEQVVDWLSLVGDSADNIAGVPGVGAKTAASLLNEYGSLETLWQRVETVERARIRESLLENRELAARNVQVIRLRRDLPVSLSWEEMQVRAPKPARLLPLLETLEFEGMAKALREPDLFG